ncbi:ASCH domain-containing protein [Acinetobacter bereziniae]|uniref:ASCH domain-containing protein n=1 Tax=Acinetobacter bereziniae TaxID=106648 RepID=UPI0021CEE061|nr:ASCH domain-containing protein [Acinetobacter bereziniae]MCU4435544.1 ASCH domain-containing protein [Acinetobacter bereziniae]
MDERKRTYQALSIVEPFGRFIAEGKKKIEIRSWQPESLPLKDLVIVENKSYLTQDGDVEIGRAVAIIDIESIHPWTESAITLAMASYWEKGYWAWVISNVRPIENLMEVPAKRKIYSIDI